VTPPHSAGMYLSSCSASSCSASSSLQAAPVFVRRLTCLLPCAARPFGRWVLIMTVKPLQRRMSDSPHQSWAYPTTTWCRASLKVLKHPHCGRSRASVINIHARIGRKSDGGSS
jgi:hypothetical protein